MHVLQDADTVEVLTDLVNQHRTALAQIRRQARAGEMPTNDVLAAKIDSLIGPDDVDDDDQPESVAAERRQPLMLVAEQGLPIPGDYKLEILQEPARVEPLTMADFVPGQHLAAESTEAQLVKMLTPPPGGLSREAKALLSEAQGEVEVSGGLPLPTHDPILLENVQAALAIAKGRKSRPFEIIGNGIPVPE